MPVVIRRAITPPHWPALSKSALGSVNISARLRFFVLVGGAHPASRIHQVMNQALALAFGEVRVGRPP